MSQSDPENNFQELKKWNPMEDDYSNLEFNQYISGPGADLDPALHSTGQVKENSVQLPVADKTESMNCPNPKLVFKNLPKGMTKNAVYNMCFRHGKISNVQECSKSGLIIVELASVSDMEAVYRALENNTYGVKISISNHEKKQQSEKIFGAEVTRNLPENSEWKDAKQIENRTYRISAKNLPRPTFVNKPLVSQDEYDKTDSLIQKIDPKRQYLIEDDAHELERAGYQGTEFIVENVEYKYRTGRAYTEMPEKTKNFLIEKSRQSKGEYNAVERVYQTHSNVEEFIKNLSIGKCAQCDCFCNTQCSYCPAYFCGIECQREAWPDHEKVCGEPISLASTINNREEKVKSEEHTSSKILYSSKCSTAINKHPKKMDSLITRIIPCSGTKVKITCISKANVVYVRPISYEIDLNFLDLLNNLFEMVNNNQLKHLQGPPKCGQIVIVRFKEQYNRAMVLNIDDLQRIKFIYIDYGNVDCINISEIYEAPDDFISEPRFATPVILKNVPNCYMTEQIRKFMYTYLEDINMVLEYSEDDYIVEKCTYMVQLIDAKTKQNFNKTIIKICEPKEPEDSYNVFFGNYVKTRHLPTGDNIELVVMDNSLLFTGYISCTTLECAVEIEKFQKDIQNYGDSLPGKVYTPRVGELCIAKYSLDGKWYRGRCLEIAGDGFPTIIFIDYGNITMVDIKDIRLYPAQFTFPVYTCDCEIEGLPEQCDDELVDVLEQMIPHNASIQCDNVKVDGEEKFHIITLSKVIKNLQDSGLLK